MLSHYNLLNIFYCKEFVLLGYCFFITGHSLPPFWDCVTASSSRVSGPIKNAGTGGYIKCTGHDLWPVDRKSKTTPIRKYNHTHRAEEETNCNGSNKTPNYMQQSIVKFYCFVLQTLLNIFRLFILCIFCTYCNKVTNGCNCLFCFVFISFIFTLHVSGSHKPIIRGVSSCFFYIQPNGCIQKTAWDTPDESPKHVG